MIMKDNGFDLNIRWHFADGGKYAFAFIALFAFLIIIYANSFQGTWQFDDTVNILENKNVSLQTLDWPAVKKTFYGMGTDKISRPLSYFSFAMNYYFDELNIIGYHVVNFLIHYLASVFLFLFIHRTLNLPKLQERYGPISYSTALLATFFWATSPVQVTAVTYIVQRMASMAGLFYIMAMYFYLKGRTANRQSRSIIYFGLCAVSAAFSISTKENAVLLPVSIWLYDLLLIQGATRQSLIRNLKIFAPLILIMAVIGLWYIDIKSILSGAAYGNRPFTLMERLLTEPGTFVVDNGASTFIPLWNYMLENNAVALLKASGRRIFVHCVITGGQALADTLSGFAQLAQTTGERNIVLWVNEYFGRVERDGRALHELPV